MTVAQEHPNGRKLLRLMMLTVTLSSMTALMFNIVLPQVSEEFRLSYAQVSWLSAGYTILYAIGTVMYGKLADRFKLKNLLSSGLALFALGSLTGLLSASYWAALAGRCLQSIGAACIPALAMIIPTRYFPPERRGQAMGLIAVGPALGSVLAPVVSALIASAAHWRWLFLPPLMILLALPFFRRLLADEPEGGVPERFDWLGGGLLTAAVALPLMGITGLGGWWIPAGLAALALFVWRVRTAKHPFIRPALFRNRRFSLAVSLSFLVQAIGISLVFLTPKLLTEVHRLDAGRIGFAMVPAALAAALLGKAGGKWADRKGNRVLYQTASGLLIACFVLLSSLADGSPLWIPVFLILGQVGQTFIGVAMSSTVSRTLPREQVGVGMGLFSMLNFIAQGTAMGLYGMIAELDAGASWNPLHGRTGPAGGIGDGSTAGSNAGILYSNLYLALAVLHVGILPVYRFFFRKETPAAGKIG